MERFSLPSLGWYGCLSVTAKHGVWRTLLTAAQGCTKHSITRRSARTARPAGYSGAEGQRLRRQALSELRSLVPAGFTAELVGPLLGCAPLHPPPPPHLLQPHSHPQLRAQAQRLQQQGPGGADRARIQQQQQQQQPALELAWRSGKDRGSQQSWSGWTWCWTPWLAVGDVETSAFQGAVCGTAPLHILMHAPFPLGWGTYRGVMPSQRLASIRPAYHLTPRLSGYLQHSSDLPPSPPPAMRQLLKWYPRLRALALQVAVQRLAPAGPRCSEYGCTAGRGAAASGPEPAAPDATPCGAAAAACWVLRMLPAGAVAPPEPQVSRV